MSGSARRRIARGLEWIALAALLAWLVVFAVRNRAVQWDAGTYHLAARAALAGLDPYSMENLTRLANGKIVFYPFVYPPIGLLPFLPLALLSLATALDLWISLKVVLIVVLVVLWRGVARGVEWLPLALVGLLSYGASALWDLRAGNMGIVEAALVWMGLAAFVRGRRTAFAAWIVAASCFKLTPAVLLLLLLTPTGDRRASATRLAIAVLALVALVWGPLWIGPAAHWRGFLSNLGEIFPVGASNPSMLALFLTYARTLMSSEDLALGLAVGGWLLFVAAVLAISARWLLATWRARDARRWVFTAVWLYVLLAPRPMAYGFVVAAPAAVALVPPPLDGPAGRRFVAVIFSVLGVPVAAGRAPTDTILQFAPIVLALLFWIAVALPAAERRVLPVEQAA